MFLLTYKTGELGYFCPYVLEHSRMLFYIQETHTSVEVSTSQPQLSLSLKI